MKTKLTTHAYCWAGGLIEFGKRVPKGAIPIAYGPDLKLRTFIDTVARHGYRTQIVKGRPTKIPGTECLLVPGVPEAPNKFDAVEALGAFIRWIQTRPPKGVTVTVGRRL